MNQNEMILNHLKRGTITPLESLRIYGIMRLGSRINDLRKEGYPILTKMIKDGKKHYAQYKLEIKFDEKGQGVIL